MFRFANKMDLAGADQEALLEELHSPLDGGCVDFTREQPARDEAVALCG